MTGVQTCALPIFTDVSNVFLGIAVTFLAATLACQYFMNNIDDKTILERTRRRMIPAAVCFVFFFVAWLCMLLFADGRAIDAAGRISIEPYKYLHNFIEMPYLAVVLLLGVVAVVLHHIGQQRQRLLRRVLRVSMLMTMVMVMVVVMVMIMSTSALIMIMFFILCMEMVMSVTVIMVMTTRML